MLSRKLWPSFCPPQMFRGYLPHQPHEAKRYHKWPNFSPPRISRSLHPSSCLVFPSSWSRLISPHPSFRLVFPSSWSRLMRRNRAGKVADHFRRKTGIFLLGTYYNNHKKEVRNTPRHTGHAKPHQQDPPGSLPSGTGSRKYFEAAFPVSAPDVPWLPATLAARGHTLPQMA